MDKYYGFAEKLKNREKTVGTTLSLLNAPLLIPQMNREDLDFIVFDLEHGVFDAQNAQQALNVCRLMGVPTIMRVQDALYHLMAKAVDMGGDGIMVPRTESLEQIRTALDALFFAPVGRKGCGGHGQFRPGENPADFNKTRFLMPQIESRKGIDLLPAILDEYGEYINAVMIGPYDMSVMLGTPFNVRSDVMRDAIQEVFDISARYGKSCGIFCDDEELAAKYRSMGANVLWLATDKDFFLCGYRQEMDAVRELK